MSTEEKISAFVWIQVAVAMLVQVLLVVFVVGFIVGHYFIGGDEVVEVAPTGEEISFGTPAPLESWSLPNGDQYNRRAADSEIDSEDVKELGAAWTLPVAAEVGPEGNAFAGTPVVGETGVAYFQDAAADVFAVDIDTGQEIWKRELEAPSAGPNGVALSHDVVYGCAASFCFALDPQTGEEIWKSKELTSGGEAIASPPQVKNGTVFVAAGAEAGGGEASGGEAIALDAASGAVVWQARGSGAPGAGAAGSGAAAIGPDGTVFIGIGGSTTALDPSGGEARWSAPGATAAAPVYSEESGRPLLLAADTDGSVAALDPRSGEQVWKAPVGGGAVTTSMALSEGVAYVAAADGGGGGGAIAAIEVGSGDVAWEEQLPAAPRGGATVSNDMVFTALEDGTVVGASRGDGQILWEAELPGPSSSPLVIEGDTLIAINGAPSGGEQPQIVAYRLGAAAEAEEEEAEAKEEAEAEGGQPGGGEGEAGRAAAGPEEGAGEAGGAEEGAAAGEAGGAAAGEGGGEEALLSEGETAFTTNCASCHTLAAAGATGTVGPDLDELKPDKALVEKQVINGGGAMPAFAGILSEEEIEAVSEYVAKAAGSGSG